MELQFYFPTFRQVLLKEVVKTKTKGGIILPSSALDEIEGKYYDVIKVGKDCTQIQPGDKVTISRGVFLEKIILMTTGINAGHETFLQLMEQQIIGYERMSKPSTLDDFTIDNTVNNELDPPKVEKEEGHSFSYTPFSEEKVTDLHNYQKRLNDGFQVEVATGLTDELLEKPFS